MRPGCGICLTQMVKEAVATGNFCMYKCPKCGHRMWLRPSDVEKPAKIIRYTLKKEHDGGEEGGGGHSG